jgi:peptidoglycan/xylan/chitin deacetylase (PgdA/CDA1 family)
MSDTLVLCYHALSPTWDTDLSITPDAFEQQIELLLRRGWHPSTFADAVLSSPRRKTLAITFDDAFASVKRYALPVLECHGAPATVFAPTAFMSGAKALSWAGMDQWGESGDAHELEAMDWADLATLAEHGWEIGSHTRTHPHLTQLGDSELARELVDSREECARALGRDCLTIAYPYGDVDDRVAEAARDAGYLAGGVLSGQLVRLGPHRHPRVGIYNTDVAWRFRLKLSRPLRELQATRLWPVRQPERDT